MPTIEQDIQQIRKAVYGKDVREAIADGIEKAYASAESAVDETENYGLEADINRDLMATGEVTVKSSWLESGYWAYARKVDNSKRLRNYKSMYVPAGTKIKYTSPTMKIYFGVLATRDAGSYSQTTGWKNASSAEAEVNIQSSGYLNIMFESTSDVTPENYDATVRIISPSKRTMESAVATANSAASTANSAITVAQSLVTETDVNHDVNTTGEHTFTSAEFENGYWSFGTKVNSTKRIRNKRQFKVAAGAVVSFTNQTMDIYFGVVPEPAAGMYLQYTGWLSPNDAERQLVIASDGWLNIMLRTVGETTDITPANYDSSILVKTSMRVAIENAANAGTSATNGHYYISNWYRGGMSSTGEDYTSANGYRSDYIEVEQEKILTISNIDDLANSGKIVSLSCAIYDDSRQIIGGIRWPFYPNEGSLYITKDIVTPFGAKYIRFAAYMVDGYVKSGMHPIEMDSVPLVQEIQYEETHHGVSEMKLQYVYRVWFDTNTDEFTTTRISRHEPVYLMPKDGFRLYVTDEVHFQLVFFKRDQTGKLVLATDYERYVKTGYARPSGYYPYAEGVYFTLGYESNAEPNFHDQVHIATGRINETGGRLPNLQPISMLGKRQNDNYNKEGQQLNVYSYWGYVSENPSAENPVWYGAMPAFFSNYCSIIPLGAVKSITVAPPYSLNARVYKIDNDNKTATIYDEIFGLVEYTPSVDSMHRMVQGVSHVDFSKYQFEGYILAMFTAPMWWAMTGGSLSRNMDTMGMMKHYKDVMNSVFVEWRAGVEVNYDNGMSGIVKKNLDTLLDTASFVNLKAGYEDSGYGNWAGNTTWKWGIDIGPCTGWWYCGSNLQNGPHMHVNPKSYITASKNQHSRVYVPKHPCPEYKNAGNLYGTVCSSTAMTLHGLPCGTETFSICSELVPNLEYRELNDIDDLRPGDLLACGSFMPDEEAERGSFGHVITITEKVSINGSVFCVNAFEGAQPFTRFRTLINNEAYPDYHGSRVHGSNQADVDIFDLYSYQSYYNSYIYHKIARVPRSMQRTFRDAYSAYDVQDYPVSAVMCDRGTDSVYCIGEHMTLTVTDGTTYVDLYVDGTLDKTVNLANYPNTTYPDGVVYTVTGMVTKNGYHQLKSGNTVLESFFVPKNRNQDVEIDTGNDTVTVFFEPSEENDTVECVAVEYYIASDGTGRPVYHWQNLDTHTVVRDGLCAYTTDRTPSFCDGVVRYPLSASTMRRTPYGTYRVCKFLYDGNIVRQRAGLTLSYEGG